MTLAGGLFSPQHRSCQNTLRLISSRMDACIKPRLPPRLSTKLYGRGALMLMPCMLPYCHHPPSTHTHTHWLSTHSHVVLHTHGAGICIRQRQMPSNAHWRGALHPECLKWAFSGDICLPKGPQKSDNNAVLFNMISNQRFCEN